MSIIFNKPYPFIFNTFSVVIPSTITFLIISFLAPLQFHELEFQPRLIIAFIISVVVALIILMTVYILKKIVSKETIEDKWTVGKELLLILTVLFNIAVIISVALFVIDDDNTSMLQLLLKTTSITIGISIIPVIIMLQFEQYKHQKSQLKKADNLTKVLQDELIATYSTKSKVQKHLVIKSENDAIQLQLNSEDLIYLKSVGNYIEVFFLNSGAIQKKLIRNRLKTFETQLPNKIFIRCHNSFIVNGNYIIKIEGNARNLRLQLKNCEEKIPVSRTKAKTISTFINQLQK
ncbi:LytR/AlgR family response regulator transcription factor [Psychroflexus sp. ALD_RP9]|uniref:LytR/AlgR family response regulator transcription factor n=1 Tax=Psychroflexus sp. ALD_RP9 TaxID=2777186 RepID=UPI001A906CB5|nr:LytTR family DNA-binding domain-containing protein [Psychroflexus sp. ALD_RP9]QSS96571.1 LytTR family transcriptional regulator [Psychroflexus sp. ALD_RP9]